jgi:hypothetical protein
MPVRNMLRLILRVPTNPVASTSKYDSFIYNTNEKISIIVNHITFAFSMTLIAVDFSK